jgi:Cu(I)/Ag(I) efflux system membrane fusion protein
MSESSDDKKDVGQLEPQLIDGPEQAPKGVRIMAVVRWVILAMAGFLAVVSWWSMAHADHMAQHAAKYQCPMHPQIVSDRPGDCPICHMSLELISAERLGESPPTKPADKASGPTSELAADRSTGAVYSCPMHPEVVSDKPGTCPKCKMDLEKKSTGTGKVGEPPPGTSRVTLALDRLQSVGVRVSEVRETEQKTSTRANASVQAPEQNVAEVHVRSAGFVEGLSVRETGVKVRRGQALVSVYSPEVYQAQSELLATRDWQTISDAGIGRVDGVRRKLELLGVSQTVTDQVVASGKPSRTIGISAPIGGYVTKKNVVLGSFVTPEMALYEIVDLSKIYVIAEVYRKDLDSVRVGAQGILTMSSGKPMGVAVTVDLVYPLVNAEARTTRVRMQLDNEKLGLLPGDFGIVEFQTTQKKAFSVPRDAVIDTGRHSYVFVEESPGKFVPTIVVLGPEDENDVIVIDGLKAGERVVSGATFLIDSESRLRASLNGQ